MASLEHVDAICPPIVLLVSMVSKGGGDLLTCVREVTC